MYNGVLFRSVGRATGRNEWGKEEKYSEGAHPCVGWLIGFPAEAGHARSSPGGPTGSCRYIAYIRCETSFYVRSVFDCIFCIDLCLLLPSYLQDSFPPFNRHHSVSLSFSSLSSSNSSLLSKYNVFHPLDFYMNIFIVSVAFSNTALSWLDMIVGFLKSQEVKRNETLQVVQYRCDVYCHLFIQSSRRVQTKNKRLVSLESFCHGKLTPGNVSCLKIDCIQLEWRTKKLGWSQFKYRIRSIFLLQVKTFEKETRVWSFQQCIKSKSRFE